MFVYVIRWELRIRGEIQFGNFDVCYQSEGSAEKAMLQDFENIKAEWTSEHGSEVEFEKGRENDGGHIGYCHVQYCEWEDYHQWWIDKLELSDE